MLYYMSNLSIQIKPPCLEYTPGGWGVCGGQPKSGQSGKISPNTFGDTYHICLFLRLFLPISEVLWGYFAQSSYESSLPTPRSSLLSLFTSIITTSLSYSYVERYLFYSILYYYFSLYAYMNEVLKCCPTLFLHLWEVPKFLIFLY